LHDTAQQQQQRIGSSRANSVVAANAVGMIKAQLEQQG